jgi:predicted O-methyltransferase YrrM
MMTLYALARRASGPVVECGVGSGFSTLALLAGTAEAGVTLTSYDINARAREAALQTIGCGPDDVRIGHWRFHARASQEAASEWAPATVGLFFLDTTHFYSDTRGELAAWAPRLRPDGVICGHDYLLHLDPIWRTTGVKRAVDEFVAEHPEYTRIVHRRDYGLFVLWPK